MSLPQVFQRNSQVILAAMILSFVGFQAHADSESSSSSASSSTKLQAAKAQAEIVTDETVKKEGEVDTDEVITNRALRAQTGAKKAYSFSSSIGYTGGSIKDPAAASRPNITGTLGAQRDPRLAGTLGAKFRLSPVQSITASVGVGVDKPFHSDARSFSERTSVSNPGVGYQVLYKLAGLQNVTSLSASAYTTSYLRKFGYSSGAAASQTLVYDFGGTKFSVGTSVSISTAFFDKSSPDLIGEQGDYSVGMYPFLEYVISDRLNFRTLVGSSADHARATDSFWTWQPNKIYQSVGVGVSITRDIFLYPNIQFIPEDIRDDRTNVALSANINL